MIQTLDDAWEWYRAVDRLVRQMRRMGARYWDRAELADLLGRDGLLRTRTAAAIEDDADRVLDDLAVLILFTVFEAEVRSIARVDAERLIRVMTHPAMRSAARDLDEALEKGSFGRVLAAYQPLDIDATAQVDQIRDFRNWVAHGRRGEAKNLTNPGQAVARMRIYLAKLAELVTDGSDVGAAPVDPAPGGDVAG